MTCSVFFRDANGVVHNIPGHLTHFEPNKESDPYVLDKMTIKYYSGAEKVYSIGREYFETLVSFADETSPSYPGIFVPGLQMGAFVRFLGSHRSLPVITNYLLHHGNMSAILLMRLHGMWEGPDVFFRVTKNGLARNCCFKFKSSMEPTITCTTCEEFLSIVTTIVDECEHYREIVDFVQKATNPTYAKKLEPFMISIDGDEDYADEIGILREIGPISDQFTMHWIARHLYKFPQHVVDKWIDASFDD